MIGTKILKRVGHNLFPGTKKLKMASLKESSKDYPSECFVGQFRAEDRKRFLRQAKGPWKDRTDLPDFAAIRRELDLMPLSGR